MSFDVHFVQVGDAPVLVGAGTEALVCACGNRLIDGFLAAQFLGVGVQCGACGAVTTTEGLPEGMMPPDFLFTAEVASAARERPMSVAAHGAVVGRTEMDRLGALMRPATPPDSVYTVTAALLDRVEALAGSVEIAFDTGDPFAGLRDHALAWSVRHLRARLRDGSWACMEDAPTSNAVTHVAGLLHFVATWSRHPLFPVMMETAGARGFSLHGLALFAAAHAMALSGNRVGFKASSGYPPRLGVFDLAIGDAEVATVHLSVFDRFEFPFGRAWSAAGLLDAVGEVVAGAQGRINLRHPGVLLLSPGTALAGFDEALIEAVQGAVSALGRKNRGLVAVAPVVLRVQAVADPHAVRFGYGLFPVRNRHCGVGGAG